MKLHAIIALACAAIISASCALADSPSRLVILHTNDTHSQIDPDRSDRGGVARRKVVIDSVRAAEPNTILIDAGDAVQGTLFFTLFRGAVEDSLMNLLGYDIQILGNHEFDNGMEELAERWKHLNAQRLTTNYDLRSTPLDSLFIPYTLRTFDGRRIGFIALNLDPAGMIAAHNSEGVGYLDPIEAGNAMAWYLRNVEHADMVVAITHIGYSGRKGASDLDLARSSRGIDIIIGGHSHTSIDPSSPDAPLHRVPNLDGDTVLIAQNGKAGVTVGEIDIDLSTLRPSSRLIPIDARLDSLTDGTVEALLTPFRAAVDSLTAIPLATTRTELPHGSPEVVNLVSDIVKAEGEKIAGRPVDLAFMNRGGIRCGIPAGVITQGLVMQMLPFENRITILEISGRELAEAFDVMASRGGDGIDASTRATFDREAARASDITINGEPIDPTRTYTLATIDYLAEGGDYMTPLTRGRVIAKDKRLVFDAVAAWLAAHPTVTPDPTRRMTAK